MSFAPPPPSDPGSGSQSPFGSPQGTGGPRSTPIPGFSSPVPGNAGSTPPPTPTDFVNASMGQSPFTPGPGAPFSQPPKRGRSWGAVILVMLLFIGPVIGIAVGIWAFFKSREVTDQAEDAFSDAEATVDSILAEVLEDVDVTVPVITVPAITVPVDPNATVAPGAETTVAPPAETVAPTVPPVIDNFADGGAVSLIASFEAAISGDPSRFMQILIYPDYAFATAQDAAVPTHVDEYPWRDGVVGPSSPVTLVGDGDLESNLFSATEIDWTFIPRAVAEAPGLTAVEEGVVSHIIVERSVFTADFAVVVRVYVSGPRGGGYVEYTPAGVLIQVMV